MSTIVTTVRIKNTPEYLRLVETICKANEDKAEVLECIHDQVGELKQNEELEISFRHLENEPAYLGHVIKYVTKKVKD
jgi:hypothetical protein